MNCEHPVKPTVTTLTAETSLLLVPARADNGEETPNIIDYQERHVVFKLLKQVFNRNP